MAEDGSAFESVIPITGRRLAMPPGPVFHLQRAGEADYELGAFRAWAGYKDLGSERATDGLALFQHVLSFGPTEVSGRTGIHCHLAHAHIVIPTSGRGVFSYDGVVTEAVPGAVIAQHGGTVHDQFDYSYAAGSPAQNKATPILLEPDAPGAAPRSFGFLELFVPAKIANVEIVPPQAVTKEDQASAWNHSYHAKAARYALQSAVGGRWRPVLGADGLEARDADTWAASGGLVRTLLFRPGAADGAGEACGTPDDPDGVEILFVAQGAAAFERAGGEAVSLEAGDCLTCSAGLVGHPMLWSPDLRLLRIFISGAAQALRERTPEEIAQLEALGPGIITGCEVRAQGDTRPVNVLAG